MKKLTPCLTLLIFLVLTLVRPAFSQEKEPVTGFMDFNGYYDTRDFNMLTITSLANLPYHFQYFSFVNFSNEIDTDQNFDLSTFYSEQNIHWAFSEEIPLDVTGQWVLTTAAGNDLGRFGFRWRVSQTSWWEKFYQKIHLFQAVYFHLLQTDFDPSPGWGWQVEHVYQLLLFPNTLQQRVYLSGFADHNMNYGGVRGGDNHQWVTEHQLGIRLIGQLYTIAEFRWNQFLNPTTGVGLGLEYKIEF